MQKGRGTSEEIRLVTMEILDVFLLTVRGEMESHMEAMYSMASSGCEDVCPKVNVACCILIQHLCGKNLPLQSIMIQEICIEIFGRRLNCVAKDFVAMVTPLMMHRQSRVRMEAVRTVGRTMYCGAHEMILELVAFQNPNVLSIKDIYGDVPKRNFMGSLATDASPLLRLTFTETIGDWMLQLPERADYTSRLLPFILCSLIDPVDTIRAAGVHILTKIGARYERDHSDEISEQQRFLPKEAQGLGWGDFQHLWTEKQGTHLLDPFEDRPSIGVLMIIQSHFGNFVGAICSDLVSSEDGTMLNALELLRVGLLLAEDSVRLYMSDILHACLKLLISRPARTESVADRVETSLSDIAFLFRCYIEDGLLLSILECHTHSDMPKCIEAMTAMKQLLNNKQECLHKGPSKWNTRA